MLLLICKYRGEERRREEEGRDGTGWREMGLTEWMERKDGRKEGGREEREIRRKKIRRVEEWEKLRLNLKKG